VSDFSRLDAPAIGNSIGLGHENKN
jgi:hypothetical protein